MEGSNSSNDILFDLWSEKVESTLYKLYRKGLDYYATTDDILTWWRMVGVEQRKSKHADTIEALNFMTCKQLRKNTGIIKSILNAKSDELGTKNAELQKSEAKIQNLQTQIDQLSSEQLALAKQCEKYKDIIADVRAKLIVRDTKSPQTLNSYGTKQDATCTKENVFSRTQKSVPISVIGVMHQHAGIESHDMKEALESHRPPEAPGEPSYKPGGKMNRLCNSCHKIGHTEEKCWSLGRGRPPPYYLKCRKSLSKGRCKQSGFAGKTLSELTALFMQGLQLLTSLASGLAAS